MKFAYKLFISFVAGIAAVSTSFAQETAVLPETSSFQFLNLHSSPRTAAMGGVVTGLSADAFAQLGNVAAVPYSDSRMALQLDYNLWQPSISGTNALALGGFFKIKKQFGVTFAVQTNIGKQYSVTVDPGMTVAYHTPIDFRAGAGFSWSPIRSLSVGVGLNYALSIPGPANDIYKNTFMTFAADVQVIWHLEGILDLSVSGNNLGLPVKLTDGTAHPIPMNAKLGLGTDQSFGKHRIAAALEGGCFFAANTSIFAGVGAEYTYNNMLSVRAGYHYGDGKEGLPSFASVGLGLRFFGITIDFAYNIASGPMANTLCAGLGFRF